MKPLYITLAIIFILVADVSCNKPKKHKKYRKPLKTSEEIDVIQAEDERRFEEEQRLVREAENVPQVVAAEADVPPEEPEEPLIDPCIKVHCGAGRVCQLDEEGEPQCVCIPSCAIETDARRKVCSNLNETWPSDCAVYQQRCLCNRGDEKCKGEEYKHVHIEYYGECRNMPDCTKEEMADFPRRMRDWLFNIMRDLADREELTPHYLKMEREAETNLTRRWTNAAIWKFCDLDGHPPDRSVSRHELFPIRAPLMSLEHCIAPFLNNCDKDNNHRITLKEWAACLELEEDDLDHQCESLRDDE